MDFRKNAGYIIINAITVGETEVVLGVHESLPNKFVTWLCNGSDNFFWGHYHTDLLSAQKDFLRRGLKEVHLREMVKKPPEKETER